MSMTPNVELGAIVICNHWTQFGIGETFPEGEIDGRWYQRNFSTVFGFEAGRSWLEARGQVAAPMGIHLPPLGDRHLPRELMPERPMKRTIT
jgi:hypothetical protein